MFAFCRYRNAEARLYHSYVHAVPIIQQRSYLRETLQQCEELQSRIEAIEAEAKFAKDTALRGLQEKEDAWNLQKERMEQHAQDQLQELHMILEETRFQAEKDERETRHAHAIELAKISEEQEVGFCLEMTHHDRGSRINPHGKRSL